MLGEVDALGQQGELFDQPQVGFPILKFSLGSGRYGLLFSIPNWSGMFNMRVAYTTGVNFSDPFLWYALVIFVLEPVHKCVIAYQENFRNGMIRLMGAKLSFRIYCILSVSYSVSTFFLFQKVVNMQPRVRELQRNEALLIGYVFALVGFCIKAHIHLTNSVSSLMGGQYFGIEILRQTRIVDVRDYYYHPLGTSSVISYFGLSVVRASAAGILLTVTLGVSTCLASLLELYYLSRIAKHKLQQQVPTPIPSLLGDSKGKEE